MYNISITENGAVGLNSTSNALVDLNFAAGSLRGKPEKTKEMFKKAYNENNVLAMQWLFFARDIRQGMGEREITRNILAWLQWKHPDVANKVICLLPEYGRWDDVVYMMEFSSTRDKAVDLIVEQLKEDIQNMQKGDKISLLCKWLPTLSASNSTSRMRAFDLAKRIGLKPADYRKMCSKMRKYADVLEGKISNNRWEDVNYSAVPSQANIKYAKAFQRHDAVRYLKYIEEVNQGKNKINAGALMPYEIVHNYLKDGSLSKYKESVDNTLESLWKSLPQIKCNAMVMLDGSASMGTSVGNSRVTCKDIASSLAIYMAQNVTGPLKGKFMTFGQYPQIVDISECKTLLDCLNVTREHSDTRNTDIYRAYKGLADMAVKYKLKQEELPERIIVLSDMEFDRGCCGTYTYESEAYNSMPIGYKEASKTLFDEIKNYWDKAGYNMPHLVFWNINSRTGTIPMRANNLGVTLLSGFSTQVVELAMSEHLEPFFALYEILSSDRYKAVEGCVMKAQ